MSARYVAARTVEEAVGVLGAEPGARVLAGGTDLLVQVKTGRASPGVFVDVKRIPRFDALVVNGGIHVGGAVPAAAIWENELIRRRWPGLAEATDLIGSVQIQGRATWAGNLCNGSPAADTVPSLIALGAEAVVAGPNGERRVPVETFVTGPGRTVLARGELVREFLVPAPAAGASDAYLRVTPRTEMDIAAAGAAVSLTVDKSGTCTAARVVIGAVGPRAVVVPAAGAALVGSKLEDAALERASAAASAAAQPIDDKRGTVAYRRKTVGVLVRRAAKIAYERARKA